LFIGHCQEYLSWVVVGIRVGINWDGLVSLFQIKGYFSFMHLLSAIAYLLLAFVFGFFYAFYCLSSLNLSL
jgi:hypothetical protein